MKKQTKYWKCKDGRKIRICDMSDSHLLNTIKMLERNSQALHFYRISNLEAAQMFFHGEMALWEVENNLMQLYEEGPNVYEDFPIYENLVEEFDRRKYTKKSK